MEEIWKDIEGYEGLYQISNLGRIKSLGNKSNHKNEKIISISSKSFSGYWVIGLCKNGKRKGYIVHRLVAKAFIPNPNNYPQINHKDENKLNNWVDNLEWCTQSYNAKYNNLSKKKNIKSANTMKLNGLYDKMRGKKYSIRVVNLTTNETFEAIGAAAKHYSEIFGTTKMAIVCKFNKARTKYGNEFECYGYKWRLEEKGE